jgi:hypothetical protein
LTQKESVYTPNCLEWCAYGNFASVGGCPTQDGIDHSCTAKFVLQLILHAVDNVTDIHW